MFALALGATATLGSGVLAACAPPGPTHRRTLGEATPTRPEPPATPPEPVLVPPAAVDPAVVVGRHTGVRPTAWGTGIDGIVSTLAAPYDEEGRPRIALTFDACGGDHGGGIDHALIDGLRSAGIGATLFLNARWIERHPGLAAELAADPLFLLGNHGTRHVPLSVAGAAAYGIAGTLSVEEAVHEVWGNQTVLTELTGRPPRHFRAGTAHYDDVAVRIVHDLGAIPVGFAVNGDGGATFSAETVHHEVLAARPGAIVLAHMNQPRGGTAAGVLRAAVDLRARGTVFAHVDA